MDIKKLAQIAGGDIVEEINKIKTSVNHG